MGGGSVRWARFAVWAVTAMAAVSGVAVAADALVESDEERIAEIADAVTARDPDRRIDAVLAWVDPERVELIVRHGGVTRRFGPGDQDPAAAIADALAPLTEQAIDVVQRSIEVRGERATIALRVRARGEIADVHIGLRRDGQAWRVSDVRRL